MASIFSLEDLSTHSANSPLQCGIGQPILLCLGVEHRASRELVLLLFEKVAGVKKTNY
jgi:hypothetical protein